MTDIAGQLSGKTLARSLLLPGPQPPLSHFGATLMRHVFGTVVRYSLYQLGLPMPDAPPVRILRLRVLLDSTPLAAVLDEVPAGSEILDALLHPGGQGELDPEAGRVRAAAALHRARLATLGLRRGRVAPTAGEAAAATAVAAASLGATAAAAPTAAAPTAAATTAGLSTAAAGAGVGGQHEAASGGPIAARSREELWSAVCSVVSGRMPYLCDAALGELVTTLARRRLRRAGKTVGPALGPVAWQVHYDRDADLRALGPLDPLSPSWAEEAVGRDEVSARARRARGEAALPNRSGRRGAFREAYRFVLTEARPLLLELGGRAVEDGIVDAPDDIFFIPFDLGSELGAAGRPSWLGPAVATNRREHEALLREPEHADTIVGPPALAPLASRSADWDLSPLLPVD